eukprot:sb/3467628/
MWFILLLNFFVSSTLIPTGNYSLSISFSIVLHISISLSFYIYFLSRILGFNIRVPVPNHLFRAGYSLHRYPPLYLSLSLSLSHSLSLTPFLSLISLEWTTVTRNVKVGPIPLDSFPIEIEAAANKKVAIRLYSEQIALNLKTVPKYNINQCTGVPYKFVEYPDSTGIPVTGTTVWRLTKAVDKVMIYCNGDKVLEYVFADSPYKSGCMETWTGQSEYKGIYFYSFDNGSKRFRGKIISRHLPALLCKTGFGKWIGHFCAIKLVREHESRERGTVYLVPINREMHGISSPV